MEESIETPTPNEAHNESNKGSKEHSKASDEPFQKPSFISPVFKKPTILIGKKASGKIKLLSSNKDSESDKKEVPSIPIEKTEKPTNPSPKESTPKSNAVPKIPTTIPYSEPSWGGIPHAKFFVEELKSGQIVNTIDLSSRSFYCVGRERNTHMNLLHPTVSRYHAILQFRSTFDEKDPVRGFYVYDMDSTHGTFLNRARIKPKMFVRIRVGHMLSFGSSTRFFILQGPSEDEEDESDLSVSELKEQRRLELEKREREAEELKRIEELTKLEKEEEEEREGVNWGMGEDAEEETDLSENPYATTNNEELYLDDPKKTLRGWFEREGEELTYDVDDVRQGEYTCRVSLPTERMLGRNMTAEVTVKGKKKEAVIQGALEACRILDRFGLLRQANHEARSKRRKKQNEDDDYNSDDDTFFDRTGAVEAKRAKKAAAQSGTVGSAHSAPVETYDTLLVKHTELVSLISSLESKLMAMTARAKRDVKKKENEEEGDSLEEFMREEVVCDTMEDKIERRKLKVEIASLRKKEEFTRKLVNVAKPASLPALKPPLPTTDSSTSLKQMSTDQSQDGEVSLDYDKKRKTVSTPNTSNISSQQKVSATISSDQSRPNSDRNSEVSLSEEKRRKEEVIETMEIDEKLEENAHHMNLSEEKHVKSDETYDQIKEKDEKNRRTKKSDEIEFEKREDKAREENLSTKEKQKEEKKKEGKEKKSKPGPSATLDFVNRKPTSSSSSKPKPTVPTTTDSMNDEDFSNTHWQPPSNQTGDGRTALNDKYGY